VLFSGNPVSGSEYVGILPKDPSTITYYRHSYSDTYYEGSEVSDYQGTHSGMISSGRFFLWHRQEVHRRS
jgi:hypothetical protein